MTITCPFCNFSNTIDPAKVPDRAVKVTCPRCKQGFTFDKSAQPVQPDSTQRPVPTEQVTCPACGLVQESHDSCKGCGINYARFQARLHARGETNEQDTFNGNLNELRRKAAQSPLEYKPKAGFWLRVVAYMLDSFLLGIVQFTLSILIAFSIGAMGITAEGDPAVNVVIWLFGVTISLGYAVFFVGYCGQTPGKMALRIKVIRTDGSQLTYGRAALREVLGKFISGILLGIGYLMVAFDSQKQGLHDKIADTYVIKL